MKKTTSTQDQEILATFLAKKFFPKQSRTVSAKQLCNYLNNKLEVINAMLQTNFKTITDASLRNMINFIRTNDLIKDGKLIANSKGYFVSNDKQQILEFVASMEGRVKAIYQATNGLRKNINNYSSPQRSSIEKTLKLIIKDDLFDSLS